MSKETDGLPSPLANLSIAADEAEHAMLRTGSGFLGEIDQIVTAAEQSAAAAAEVERWLWENVVANDVLPRELPEEIAESLRRLHEESYRVKSLGIDVADRIRNSPLDKLFRGLPLSSTEYHFLRAIGALEGTTKALGLAAVDDYEAFCMLYYEDERLCTYINPRSAQLRTPAAGLRFSPPPEELELGALRPEQQSFFAQYLPDLLPRFRRDDPSGPSRAS